MRYTSPMLYDATTTIGRSAPLLNGSAADLAGVPVGTLGTIVSDGSFGITPPALSAQLTGLIPGARMEVIGGAGHLANLEQDVAFNSAVDRFLSEID